jgi:hypothetical protein
MAISARTNLDYGGVYRPQNIPPSVADGQPVVHQQLQDLIRRSSAVAATTANITLSAPQTIDGIAVVAGDRVLVKNQTTASENGLYVVAAGAWTRAPQTDTATGLFGLSVYVASGTANNDTSWAVSNDTLPVVGTTAITFGQTSGGTAASATAAEIAAGTPSGNIVTAGALFAAASTYARAFSATFGDGTALTYAITHGLNRQNVVSMVVDATTNAQVLCDITNTSATVVTVSGFAAGSAPATNSLRLNVVG